MQFRYARHTNNLEQLKTFYLEVLGFELLGKFKNHDDYDGVFIGIQDENWHLEFTQSSENTNHKFDEDDVLVFYPNSKLEYELLVNRIEKNNIQFSKAKNPYWNENGKMFFDPDGYRIVISHLKIK
jgi:catechol 2,3-dioxygenase-like lactoylglutathione lyase family enzyme